MCPREACPACGARQPGVLFRRSYRDPLLRETLGRFYGESFRREYEVLEDAEFVLLQCRDCALIYQQQVPDAVLLARLYEGWIDPAASLACFEATVRPEEAFETVRDAFIGLSLAESGRRPQRTLDIGCGWGGWPLATMISGAEAWGTEVSPTRSGYCTARGIHMVDEEALPDGYFDVINLNQVFEHLPEPRASLERLTRALRPGGIVRIAVPNGRFVPRALRRFEAELHRPQGGGLYAVAPLQHLSCFRTETLVALAGHVGLQRVRPPWRLLLASLRIPPRPKPAIKAILRPLYLRSGYTTDLLFRKGGG